MLIDTSMICPGDTIGLSFLKVLCVEDDHVVIGDMKGWACRFHKSQVTSHQPAPYQFQVGDTVRYGLARSLGTIEHIARGKARVLWHDGEDGLEDLSELTFVETAA